MKFQSANQHSPAKLHFQSNCSIRNLGKKIQTRLGSVLILTRNVGVKKIHHVVTLRSDTSYFIILYICLMLKVIWQRVHLSRSIQMGKSISSIILYPDYAPADLRYFSPQYWLQCVLHLFQANINSKIQSIVAHEPNYHIASVFIAWSLSMTKMTWNLHRSNMHMSSYIQSPIA